MTPGEQAPASDLPALTAVFALVIGFTFSDDLVEFGLDLAGRPSADLASWLTFALDVLLVSATAVLKWRITGGGNLTVFLRRLFTGWWALGAALVVAGHVVLRLIAGHRDDLGDVAAVWVSLLASLVFVTAMTLLLISALGDGPGSRTWVVPLVVGTFVVQTASALWYPVIDADKGCAGNISWSYFSEMTNISSIVLLALGIELAYVRRTARIPDPGRRVAPVFTMLMLCLGVVLSFTMLVKAGIGTRCGLAAVWHEYIAFVVTAQALTIGLATVLWLLVTDTDPAGPKGSRQ